MPTHGTGQSTTVKLNEADPPTVFFPWDHNPMRPKMFMVPPEYGKVNYDVAESEYWAFNPDGSVTSYDYSPIYEVNNAAHAPNTPGIFDVAGYALRAGGYSAFRANQGHPSKGPPGLYMPEEFTFAVHADVQAFLAPRCHGGRVDGSFWILDTGASDWFVRPTPDIDCKFPLGDTNVDKAGGASNQHKQNLIGEILIGPDHPQLMPVGLCVANNILSYIHVQGQAGPYVGFLEPWEAEAILSILAPRYLQEPTVNNLPHYDPYRAELARTVYAAMVGNNGGYDTSSLGAMLKPRPRMRDVDGTGSMIATSGPNFRMGGA